MLKKWLEVTWKILLLRGIVGVLFVRETIDSVVACTNSDSTYPSE